MLIYADENPLKMFFRVPLRIIPIMVSGFKSAIVLSDCSGIRTHNYLVCKRTLYHLANLACFTGWCLSFEQKMIMEWKFYYVD